MSTRLSVFAPAKLNLYLKVCEKLIDGFHRIETIYQSIDLFDQLVFEISKTQENRPEIKIVLSPGPQSHLLPADGRNLAYQAARLFFDKTQITHQKLKINIAKQIPISGGLAGGSTNAAATIYALNYLFGEPLEQDEMLSLCQELGSDVPFCFLGGSMIGTGRGDQLTRIALSLDYTFVLVFPPPNLELKAKEVYQSFDELNQQDFPEVKIEKFLEVLLTKGNISKYLFNSLEEAAIHSSYWVEKAKSAIDAKGFTSLVSGSGPTVFTISPNEMMAQQLSKALEADGFQTGIHRAIDNSFQIIAH
jgi:4-diphosphocytidyl-2-C-methyl-D-erythritol kinase